MLVFREQGVARELTQSELTMDSVIAAMFDPVSPLGRLLRAPMRPGVVRWLAVRPARRAPMAASGTLQLDPSYGVPQQLVSPLVHARQLPLSDQTRCTMFTSSRPTNILTSRN